MTLELAIEWTEQAAGGNWVIYLNVLTTIMDMCTCIDLHVCIYTEQGSASAASQHLQASMYCRQHSFSAAIIVFDVTKLSYAFSWFLHVHK